MEKVAYGTAFLPKFAANIDDLNRDQFMQVGDECRAGFIPLACIALRQNDEGGAIGIATLLPDLEVDWVNRSCF